MRAYAIALATLLLFGCKSEWTGQSASDVSHLPWLTGRQRQLQNAAKRAEAARDYRPYPVGWPTDTLPLHRDPRVAQAIGLGQTTNQVVQVMGKEGWTNSESRAQFLDVIHKTYEVPRSSFKMPEKYSEAVKRVPETGHFFCWEYQGFPSSADWVVVFFASSDADSSAEPRVVARGVFRLGDF